MIQIIIIFLITFCNQSNILYIISGQRERLLLFCLGNNFIQLLINYTAILLRNTNSKEIVLFSYIFLETLSFKKKLIKNKSFSKWKRGVQIVANIPKYWQNENKRKRHSKKKLKRGINCKRLKKPGVDNLKQFRY